MPGIGAGGAGTTSVQKANTPGTVFAPDVNVSRNASPDLDFRDPRQAGQSELAKNAGFETFMKSLITVGGEVSNQFQAKVETRQAGELINSPEAMEIIKSGSGPANGLLWSFRNEIRDNVVGIAATEVVRDAKEKFAINFAADDDLKNQDWLLNAKPEDWVKKFSSLQDSGTMEQLRNLTVMSPNGTASLVADYQGYISNARQQKRAEGLVMRLENNATIVSKELDADVLTRLDAKESLVQAEKDGFGGEVEDWTVKNVDEVAPKLREKARALGVPVSKVLLTNVQQTFGRIDSLVVTITEQLKNNEEADVTPLIEEMHREWQMAGFYRALADSPDLKTKPEDASVFTLRSPTDGKTWDDRFTEYREKYFSSLERIETAQGQALAERAFVETSTDPEGTQESIAPKVEALLAQAPNWKTKAMIIKATRESLSWNMGMDDRQRAAIERQALYEVKAIEARGGTPTDADLERVLALGPEGTAAASEIFRIQKTKEAQQDAQIKQQDQELVQTTEEEAKKWFPDVSRIAGAAVDLEGMIADGKDFGSISMTAVTMDAAGLQNTINTRLQGVLRTKFREELVRTGGTEISKERAEVIVKAALEEVKMDALNSLPPPPGALKGVPPPKPGQVQLLEEQAYDVQIRANGGRPTIIAIPKRIRERVLQKNRNATFTDMMAEWNRESANVDIKGPDGKPIYTKDIGTQRQERLRKIQDEMRKDGTMKPTITLPYIGDPVKAGYGVKQGLDRTVRSVYERAMQGWSMFGITPEDTGPLNSVMPQSETVSVTVPAPGKPAAKPAVPDTSGIPPEAVPKVQAGILRIAGVDPDKVPAASSDGTSKALLNGEAPNLAFAGQLATNKASMKAESPPLPQAAPELEAVRISPNARSKDSPWVYAVLATSYKASARARGGNITLPDWWFDKKPGSLGLEGDYSSGGGDFQPNSSGQYIAVKGFGYSTDGTNQSLHGLKGLPGYDPAHEDHFHHGAANNKIALELAQHLRKKGWIITAFAPWGPVGDIHQDPGHKGGSSFDMKHGVEDHKRIMKDINEFYVMKGRRGEGPQQAGGGSNDWRGVVAAAKRAGARHPELVAAQWALESGWGKHQSGKNNFFGQKGRGSTRTTEEVVNGRRVTIQDQFMDFPSMDASVKYLVDKWYKGTGGANQGADVRQAAQILKSGGYATDPKYVDLLMDIIKGQRGKQ